MSFENQIEIANATTQNIVNDDPSNTIDLQRQSNEGQVPMGFIAGLLKSYLAVWPWLTRDTLNNELRCRKRLGSHLIWTTNADLFTTSVIDIAVAGPRAKGSQPSGTTDMMKKKCEMTIIAAKDKIPHRQNNFGSYQHKHRKQSDCSNPKGRGSKARAFRKCG